MTQTKSTRGASAGRIDLTIDWSGVKSTSLSKPFPVTSGVPFDRGALPDARQVSLHAGTKKLPLQTQVLAWWPDKSVKWLLLDFQATPAVRKVVLKFGRECSPAKMLTAIAARQDARSISLDTGPLKLVVRRGGCGFIDSASYKGRKVFDAAGKRMNLMDMVHTAGPADYHPMNRYLTAATEDPSRLKMDSISLESAGPLRATILITGRYRYKLVGSTIKGTDVKGDCPFRIRVHAYAGASFLKVEHFYYYEGDGDHDFTRTLALKLPLPEGAPSVRYIDGEGKATPLAGRVAGLYQQSADDFAAWTGDGKQAGIVARGSRFDGVMDVCAGKVGVAFGVKDFWQNAAKSLQVDATGRELTMYFWPPEAPPLDYRRHARDWSVGESYSPRDPEGTCAAPFDKRKFPNYHLASKGVGKTHYAVVNFHSPGADTKELAAVFRLFNHRPLVWAAPEHYAGTLALGRYRPVVPGEHERLEEALDMPLRFWMFSQERFRWYGYWLFGQLCQEFNHYQQNGRWVSDFGRWGWACGDSVGRLAYALMLQAVRKCERKDLEFAERYLYSVHDVCSTHSEAYPHHFRKRFIYVKGGAHRHNAWPWAGPYCGARGGHPVGAKIFYFLTGEGHARDILDEMTQLALKNPHGGEGDGPLGINAQSFLYQWEATGDDKWLKRLKEDIDTNPHLKTATSGWMVMMTAAFGMYNALEEYMELTGDHSDASLAADYADRAMPDLQQNWTWPDGYFRVYSCGYNFTGDEKYRDAMKLGLKVMADHALSSAAAATPEADWPGPAGGPRTYVDGNVLRDVPFALYSMHNKPLVRKTTGK